MLVPAGGVAVELYVAPEGSNDDHCTRTAPCLTIAGASALVAVGTTIHVAPGTYSGGITTVASGTPAQRIRYVSDVKWGAKIIGSAKGREDIAWWNKGAFVDIDGFEVDGSGSPVWRIGLYNTGSGSRIVNSHVHNIAKGRADCPKSGGAGIESDGYYGAKQGRIESNLVHDIGPTGCILFHGIYHTHDGTVRNNVVYGASGWGISLWHAASDVSITNNTVFANGYGGITVGAQPPKTADQVLVANNLVCDNRYGIVEFGGTGIHNVYQNNLLRDNVVDWKLQNGLTPEESVGCAGARVEHRSCGGGVEEVSMGPPDVGAAPEVSTPVRASSDAPCPQSAAPDARADRNPSAETLK
jgi:parallel beta-helix repeat protein